MASSLQTLLKRSPPPTRILTALQNPQSLNPTKPLFLSQPNFIEPKHDLNSLAKLSPFWGLAKKDDNLSTHFNSSIFYPNSPFGFCLDPICLTGLIQSEPNNDADSGIWADSVKKKRKRKMNKHKYKKLRKRLRRQT